MRPSSPIVISLGILIGVGGRAIAQPEGATGPNRYALLVGCTRYPSLPRERWLEGPANDVILMRDLLSGRYHFSPENIVTLAEGGGEDRRPTRALIRREFSRLAEVARRGDRVVILLAGHGSQQPDRDPPDPDDPEPDGLDEIFLPADIGKWDRNRQVVDNAIVDDELRAWLKAIRDKGASLWVVVDACHSGTMVRGNDEQVLRQVAADELVPRDVLEQVRQRPARGALRSRGTTDEVPFELPTQATGLVALYAAQPEEPTVEMRLPRESPARKYQGLLTYVLCQILTEARSRLTYRQLAGRIHGQYTAMGLTFPTPLLEGKDQDRFILDDAEEPEPTRITLAREGDAWRINAGALHGLTPGSILAVYPEAGREKADEVVGHVRILNEGLQVLEAQVEPCEFAWMPRRVDLPDRGQCRPVAIDYGDLRIKVAADVVVGLDATTDGKGAVPATAADRRRLDDMIRGISGVSSSPLERADNPGQADWLVRLAAPGADKVYLVPATGWLPERGTDRLPTVLGPLEADPAVLKDRLARIARARNLLKIAGDPASESLSGDSNLGVKVELLRFDNESDRVGKVIQWQGRKLEFHEGEVIGLRVENQEREPIDVTVLFLNSGYCITPFIPRSPGADNRLPPHLATSNSPGRAALTRRFRVTDETVGLEHLVVIAVRAKAEEQPADFSFLARESITTARDAAGLRGGERRTIDSPLGRLFQGALYAAGGTRGAISTGIDDYSLVLLSWRTTARQRRE